jgi:hypothetical protein
MSENYGEICVCAIVCLFLFPWDPHIQGVLAGRFSVDIDKKDATPVFLMGASSTVKDWRISNLFIGLN